MTGMDDLRRLVADTAKAEETDLDELAEREWVAAKIQKALRTGFSVTFHKPRELRLLLRVLANDRY
jgi:hypothetical protein